MIPKNLNIWNILFNDESISKWAVAFCVTNEDFGNITMQVLSCDYAKNQKLGRDRLLFLIEEYEKRK